MQSNKSLTHTFSKNQVLDVIIPTCNEYDNLAQLIPYLQQHTTKGLVNIIVVDSHSSADDTEDLCSSSGVQYIRAKATQRSTQLNLGSLHAQGGVIMFLHADVLPPEDFYNLIIHAVHTGIEAGFFSYQFNHDSLLLKINSYFTRFDGLFSGGGDQCQFFSKSCFESLGGYDDEYVIMEDFEIFDRIKKLHIPYQLIKSNAKVSARKYKNNSYFKVNIINLLTIIRYRLGKDPKALKASYEHWL